MQINPARLAVLHTRNARSLLAAGRRKRAIRKLKQARRAIAGLADPRFAVASLWLRKALKNLKRFEDKRCQRRCKAVIHLLSGPMT